jgi:hypothetical protein
MNGHVIVSSPNSLFNCQRPAETSRLSRTRTTLVRPSHLTCQPLIQTFRDRPPDQSPVRRRSFLGFRPVPVKCFFHSFSKSKLSTRPPFRKRRRRLLGSRLFGVKHFLYFFFNAVSVLSESFLPSATKSVSIQNLFSGQALFSNKIQFRVVVYL